MGESVNLWAKGGSDRATYSWSPCASLRPCTGDTVAASPRATTTYTVTLSEPWGCVVRDTVHVDVYTEARIIEHAKSITMCDSTHATFTVRAGGADLNFRWQVNDGSGWKFISSLPTTPNPYWTEQSGATTNILHIGPNAANPSAAPLTQALDGYKYRCVVDGRKNTAGDRDTLYSNDYMTVGEAVLKVKPLQHSNPFIVRVPNDTLCEGEKATFELKFGTNPSASYSVDWLVDSVVKQSGKSLTFTTPVNNGTKIQAVVYTGYDCPVCDPEPSNELIAVAHLWPVVNAGANANVTVQYNTDTTLRGTLVATNVLLPGSQAMSYKWTWTPASVSGAIKGVDTQLVAKTNIITQDLYYILSGTNSNGCVGRDTLKVICKGGPLGMDGDRRKKAFVRQSIEICEGDSLCIGGVPEGGSGNYHHVWTATPQGSTPANSSFTDADTSSICMHSSPVGTTVYLLTVDDGVDTVYKEITVKVLPRTLREPKLTGDSILCNANNRFNVYPDDKSNVSGYAWYIKKPNTSAFQLLRSYNNSSTYN